MDSDDFSHPETVPEVTSSQLVTPTGDEEKHPLSNAAVERLVSGSLDKKGYLRNSDRGEQAKQKKSINQRTYRGIYPVDDMKEC